MFVHHWKIAWRNIRRHSWFTAVNTFGLGGSLAVCMMILLYVQHERHYDSFHRRASNIVWVHALSQWGSDTVPSNLMSYATGEIAQRNIPQVKAVVRLRAEHPDPVLQAEGQPENRHTEKEFVFADSNFFQVFSFPLLQGNPDKVLEKPFTLVISENLAHKYFGNSDPVGARLQFNGKYTFTITGVISNTPSNSSIRYGCIASMASLNSMEDKLWEIKNTRLQGGSFETFLLLNQPMAPSAMEKSLGDLQKRLDPDNATPDRFLITPLAQRHMSSTYASDAAVRYLSLFILVAVVLLLLGLTNYVSLATAGAALRAREIGIRKTMGAGRGAIAWQFFGESVWHTSLAFIFGYLLFYLFEEHFLQFLQLPIDHNFLSNTTVLISFAVLFVASAVLAGIYPSLVLSAYAPAKALYGKILPRSGELSLRKFITVFQFSLSVALIICGIVINRQVNFFRNTDTGMNRENVVLIPFSETMGHHFGAFRSAVAALPGVQRVAANHYAMYGGSDIWMAQSPGDSKGTRLSVFNVDQQFGPLLQLKWSVPPDDSLYMHKRQQIVLNETAVDLLHLKPNTLHQQIIIGNDMHLELAGILKDFNFKSLQEKIEPMGLFVAEDSAEIWTRINGTLLVKVDAHVNLPTLLDHIKAVYAGFDQNIPFSYTFLDETFDNLYQAEARLAQLFIWFIGVAIGIAALGLFGLVTFITARRTKEIGIRKILGASVIQVVGLLGKDFVALVILAWVIASPIAWLAMRRWLESFAYRIEMQWWMLTVAGLVAVGIAVVTIAIQSFRAASANPVKALNAD